MGEKKNIFLRNHGKRTRRWLRAGATKTNRSNTHKTTSHEMSSSSCKCEYVETHGAATTTKAKTRSILLPSFLPFCRYLLSSTIPVAARGGNLAYKQFLLLEFLSSSLSSSPSKTAREPPPFPEKRLNKTKQNKTEQNSKKEKESTLAASVQA